ncbi:MAG: hypothetical protein MHM6MM_005194 [Cercozoa sp. M6MM]
MRLHILNDPRSSFAGDLSRRVQSLLHAPPDCDVSYAYVPQHGDEAGVVASLLTAIVRIVCNIDVRQETVLAVASEDTRLVSALQSVRDMVRLVVASTSPALREVAHDHVPMLTHSASLSRCSSNSHLQGLVSPLADFDESQKSRQLESPPQSSSLKNTRMLRAVASVPDFFDLPVSTPSPAPMFEYSPASALRTSSSSSSLSSMPMLPTPTQTAPPQFPVYGVSVNNSNNNNNNNSSSNAIAVGSSTRGTVSTRQRRNRRTRRRQLQDAASVSRRRDRRNQKGPPTVDGSLLQPGVVSWDRLLSIDWSAITPPHNDDETRARCRFFQRPWKCPQRNACPLRHCTPSQVFTGACPSVPPKIHRDILAVLRQSRYLHTGVPSSQFASLFRLLHGVELKLTELGVSRLVQLFAADQLRDLVEAVNIPSESSGGLGTSGVHFRLTLEGVQRSHAL